MSFKYYNVLSLNVNGLNSPVKRSKLVVKMKKENVAIAYWQETHLSNSEHDKLKRMGFKNSYYSSHKSGKKRGVAILISNRTKFEFISEISDKEGRFILVKGKIDHKEVTLLNVYAPPGSNISFYKKVFELITTESYGSLICAGDFNLLLNPHLDTTNTKRKRTPIERRVKKMLSGLGLIDVWRYLHASAPGFTFYSARHSVHSRIDYFFMFNKDLNRIKDCRLGQRDISDHSGIYLNLHLDGQPRKTLWRLNTGMMNDPTFTESMTNDLNLYMQENDNGETNPSIIWDAAKAVLRGKIIARSAMLKKQKTQKLLKLQERLKDLENTQLINKSPTVTTNKSGKTRNRQDAMRGSREKHSFHETEIL